MTGIDLQVDGNRYAILDQGAHGLAWQPAGERAVIWCSRLARFEPGVAVRGGIPVIYPWFGSGPGAHRSPPHGTARTSQWTREEVEVTGSELRVRHRLNPDVTLLTHFSPTALTVSLRVGNSSPNPITHEAALHTYLALSDITRARVSGLEDCEYIDTVPGAVPGPHRQVGSVTFDAETDRLYRHVGEVRLVDPGWGRTLRVAKSGSATTVVWNPWATKAAAMADFGDQEWRQMLCIEAGNLREDAVTLLPGEHHTLTQSLSLA